MTTGELPDIVERLRNKSFTSTWEDRDEAADLIDRLRATPPGSPVGWQWPRALNVTRSVHNHWHGDISFARSPTDKELRNLDEFLNAHHINAPPPPAGAYAREPVGCVVAHCGRRGGNCQCASVQECCACG